MPHSLRLACRRGLVVLLLGAAAMLGRAQAPVTPPTAEELAAAGLASRTWELTGNLRTAFGYKENLLLSAVRAEDSGFVQTEGEVFWWRLPTERFEALAFANGTFTRFFESRENPREWQAFAHAEARWFAGGNVQVTASGEGYHLDQIFDLSASSAERLTARLAVSGVLGSTAVRWNLRPDTWLELKPTLQRDRYEDHSDDHRQEIGRATLGHKFFGGRLEVALAGQVLRRDYDHRPQYTAAGRPLAGSALEFRQRDGEARIVVAWDEAQRWSTTTAAVAGDNRDNGSGFFDYRQRSVRQELTWTRRPWKVRVVGRAGRYDYDVQTEGIGIDPPKRLKEEFLGQARVERDWTKSARMYLDFIWERSRSNDPLSSYRAKTMSAGVDWAF